MKKLLSLAMIGLTLSLGACQDVAAPEGAAPDPAFSKVGQGNGTTFLLKAEVGGIIGWGTVDFDGDQCFARLAGLGLDAFDANDFVKISPDGVALDFTRGEVDIWFNDASGTLWTGSGHGHLKSQGFGYWNSNVTGKVTDGVETKTAVCSTLTDSDKGINKRENKLNG